MAYHHKENNSEPNFFQALKDAWEDNDAVKFNGCLNNFKLHMKSKDAKKLIKYMINKTSDDKFNLKCKDFWLIIFRHGIHRNMSRTGVSFIGLLVQNGNLKVLLLLFENPFSKPNLRYCGPHANTPLHYLCKQNWEGKEKLYQKCMAWLLENEEVDVNAFNCDCESPLDLAKELGNELAMKMLSASEKLDRRPNRRKEILRYLNSNGIEMTVMKYSLGRLSFSELYSLFKLVTRKSRESVYLTHWLLDMEDALGNWPKSKWEILLQEACFTDLMVDPFYIEKILLNGANPSAVDEWNDNLSAFGIAEEMRNIRMLPMLWEYEELDDLGGYRKIDSSLLRHMDSNGNNILHHASNLRCRRAMFRILESGGFVLLGSKNNKQEVPIIPEDLLQTNVIKRFLDTKIQKSADYDGSIQFNLTSWFLGEDFPVMNNLIEISKIRQYRHYITHPVIKIFLLNRWKNLKWIFLINLWFCLALTSCITFNVLWTSTAFSTRILQALLICSSIRALLQFKFQMKDYFAPAQYENYCEMLIIILGGYLTIADCRNEACQQIGAFVILLSWSQLTLLIGKHPGFSVQVEMFLLVLTSFVKFSVVYLLIFSVLLCLKSTANSKSIFQKFIVFVTQYYPSGIPFGNYPGSHIVFLLFLFIFAMLLNFSSGLAVYDTQKIKQVASFQTFLARLNYLVSLEKFSDIYSKIAGGYLAQERSISIFFNVNHKDIRKEVYQILYERRNERSTSFERKKYFESLHIGTGYM